MKTELGSIHAILHTLEWACTKLGREPSPEKLEALGLTVHQAMAGKARLFHTHDHIFELAQGADPLQTLASYFHDLIYVQVDGGLPRDTEALLANYFEGREGSYRLKDFDLKSDPPAQLVCGIFGFTPGQILSVFAGLNEFLSALVAAVQMWPVLTPGQVAQVVACIEATTPFRVEDATGKGPFERLAARLAQVNQDMGLGLSQAELEASVRRAVWLANKDVVNFGLKDPGAFLDNTWKLLPETNAALVTGTYTIREYRTALQKMEGFLSRLKPEQVFHQWGDEPRAKVYATLQKRAAENLDISVRYLRIKLYTIALLEAFATLTGGDAPVALFTGGLVTARQKPRRLEDFLPRSKGKPSPDTHKVVRALLERGRSGESSFDLKNSPISAYLYRKLGEGGINDGLVAARKMFGRDLEPQAFLECQDRAAITTLLKAASQLVVTRREKLEALSASLDSPAPVAAAS